MQKLVEKWTELRRFKEVEDALWNRSRVAARFPQACQIAVVALRLRCYSSVIMRRPSYASVCPGFVSTCPVRVRYALLAV